jgi:enoyl-CoA hydratase/carnithine racemase
MADDTAAPPVLTEVRGRVLVITLNRPEAMNAVDTPLTDALTAAFERLDTDDALSAGVLTGAGRGFCSGMDLKAFAAGESVAPEGHAEWGFGGFAKQFTSKPMIAAVNGPAMGGGAELALACDLIVADPSATFGWPEVTRGVFAGAGGLIRLAQQVPMRRALELVLTGQPIDASTALAWNLINRVASPALGEALQLAQVIAANAPLSVQASKRLLHKSMHADAWSAEAWERNERGRSALYASRDTREGTRAFAEKRPPVWEGR